MSSNNMPPPPPPFPLSGVALPSRVEGPPIAGRDRLAMLQGEAAAFNNNHGGNSNSQLHEAAGLDTLHSGTGSASISIDAVGYSTYSNNNPAMASRFQPLRQHHFQPPAAPEYQQQPQPQYHHHQQQQQQQQQHSQLQPPLQHYRPAPVQGTYLSPPPPLMHPPSSTENSPRAAAVIAVAQPAADRYNRPLPPPPPSLQQHPYPQPPLIQQQQQHSLHSTYAGPPLSAHPHSNPAFAQPPVLMHQQHGPPPTMHSFVPPLAQQQQQIPGHYSEPPPPLPSSSSSSSRHQKYAQQQADDDTEGHLFPPNPSPKEPRKRTSSRIDPSQMPRPPKLPTDITYHTRSGGARKVPPLTNAGYLSVDTGNCSPRHIRATMCAPPVSNYMANQLGIPFGAVVTPFAAPENGEEPVPIVSVGSDGMPPRCSRCRGYINPSSAFSVADNGNTWSCNMCGMTNPTPAWYYCSLDGSGQRLDKKSRPELSLGSVDFSVGPEYCLREPQRPQYLFAVDVSRRAVQSGVFVASLRAVQSVLPYLPGGDAVRAGIFTFSDQIHFYSAREGAAEPVSLYIADSEEPVAALPESMWLFSPSTQMQQLQLLLRKIPELIPHIQSRAGASGAGDTEPSRACPTAAIKAGQLALERSGGRVIVLTPSHPSAGLGKMRNRETNSLYGSQNEFCMYGATETLVNVIKTPDDRACLQVYSDLAADCIRSSVAVDVFLCCDDTEFRDTACIGDVCDRSGGCLHLMTGHMGLEANAHRLEQELNATAAAFCGGEAVLKMRTSVGVCVDKVLGRGEYSAANEETALAGVDRESTFVYTLRLEQTLKDDDKVHLQCAALYTSIDHRRLVRVHNLSLICSNNHTTVFRHADLDAVVATLAKLGVERALHSSLYEEVGGARTFLNNQVVDILHKYRTHCSAQSPRGQLILPESLKLLPLYTLGMLKHPALVENPTQPAGFEGPAIGSAGYGRSGAPQLRLSVRAHERACCLRRLRAASARDVVNALYPRLYCLNDLAYDDQDVVPPLLPVSSEVFQSDGIYLMDDQACLWMYIGRSVSSDRLKEWFDLGPGDRPDSVSFRLTSDTACRMAQVVEALRGQGLHKAELKVVWADEQTHTPDTSRFGMRIVEDSIFGVMSYVDYLCKVHSRIQLRGQSGQ